MAIRTARTEVVVPEVQVRAESEVGELAPAQEGPGIDRLTPLANQLGDLGTGGACKQGEFGKGIFFGGRWGKADQNRALFALL